MTSLTGFPLTTPSFKYHSCQLSFYCSHHYICMIDMIFADSVSEILSACMWYATPSLQSQSYDESTQTKDKHMSKLRRRRDCHL